MQSREAFRIPRLDPSATSRPAHHVSAAARIFPYLAALLLLIYPLSSQAQLEYEITIETTLGDTTETFWLQIPAGYDPGNPCPLLLGWHQWGGNHWEMKHASAFDSVANARGWIAASHHGTSTTHWTNHATQSHVVDVIQWIQEHYSVDAARIYMVGASMGGAAGMVFSNNHLDPNGLMVAAAASISGIQDCERRFHEQGINYSMIEAFGGTPEEVPHEYHRNSAIYFADSTESMHYSARHLPLFLTFGQGTSDLIWRLHAEDLYAVMAGWADTVVIRESSISGHGWGCAEEDIICDFLGSFVLDRFPASISVNADEEGHWYWADVLMREPSASFARIEGATDSGSAHLDLAMLHNVSSARLDLASIGFPLDQDSFSCRWGVGDAGPAQLAFLDVPVCPSVVLRDGIIYEQWMYDPDEEILILEGEDEALYAIFFDPASAPSDALDPSPARILRAWSTAGGDVCYRLLSPGRLSWAVFDPLGRRVTARALGWSEAGSGSIPIAEPLSSGIYFTVLWLDGPSPCRAVCKIAVVR